MSGRTCYRCGTESVPAMSNGILVDAPGWSTVTVTGLPVTNHLVCTGCATAVSRLLATPPDIAAPAAAVTARIVGVDPGGTTGVFLLALSGGRICTTAAVQVRGENAVEPVVEALLGDPYADRHLAVEAFVVGPRAARSATPQAAAAARHIIGNLMAVARRLDAALVTRTAAAVKPWATDKRLDAAGLLADCKAMPHARDAARHALFAAVHGGLLRDPLSAKAVGE